MDTPHHPVVPADPVREAEDRIASSWLPFPAVAGLCTLHGLNTATGWLFAAPTATAFAT